MTAKFYTIPAGLSFTKALAEKLLQETKSEPEALSQIRILLPTRRACRVLQDTFLDLSDGKPLLLPRMQPLGDVDEDELTLAALDEQLVKRIDLPPALPPLRRQLLLARLIMALPDFVQSTDHALGLAKALSTLMDQIYTENLSLKNLEQLVPADFADHWHITIDFLTILSEAWPQILEDEGAIDGADRRNRMILALAEHWEKTLPQTRIIGAGSTGSIPATARLLDVIAHLPNGEVVLPGFDLDIQEDEWNALEETHPQFGFKHLLSTLNIAPKAVRVWDHDDHPQLHEDRRHLAHEIMRPAAQTSKWMSLKDDAEHCTSLKNALHDLSLLQCDHAGEEAHTIAILMREALEKPGKTAALITPDRNLARRVAMICRRWNIDIDDSAGQSLDQTPLGGFLMLSLECCLENLRPITLLSLLKHRYSTILEHAEIQMLDQHVLRGPKPPPGFEGLETRAQGEDVPDTCAAMIETLKTALQPFIKLCGETHHFQHFLSAHSTLIQTLAGEHTPWNQEEAESAEQLFNELQSHASLLGNISIKDYRDALLQFLRGRTVRSKYGMHPRLQVLGQLESRLINADLVILGGLNESTWPAELAHDPWMSRHMRKDFGLPVAERSIGLSAHDFVQGLCSQNVVLTRSLRQDGAPSVPARWLERLKTVMTALDIDFKTLENKPHKEWARALDQHTDIHPFTRPEPRPPVEARPTQLSATRIETWLKDPYSIYARYVLKLRPLDPLEQDIDAAARGTILHNALERFIKTYPHEMPQDAAHILTNFAQEDARLTHNNDDAWTFWWPRFERLSTWFAGHETQWRQRARTAVTEVTGQATITAQDYSLTLTARADRIDIIDGGAAIIDYKSGGTYSKSKIKSGALPQLPVEALIISKSGFKSLPSAVSSLSYWTLTGGTNPGSITEISDGMDEILERTQNGLETLIDIFGRQDTPYYSLPRPENTPRFNDYEHLARVKEWTALDDDLGEVA